MCRDRVKSRPGTWVVDFDQFLHLTFDLRVGHRRHRWYLLGHDRAALRRGGPSKRIAKYVGHLHALGYLMLTTYRLALMWLTVSMPSLFSEAIALEIRDQGSSRPFLYPQIYTGLTFGVAALFLLELRRTKWGLKTWEKHR